MTTHAIQCGNMQGVDISKVSAVSQQLSLVAEFQLRECAGEDVSIIMSQLSLEEKLTQKM